MLEGSIAAGIGLPLDQYEYSSKTRYTRLDVTWMIAPAFTLLCSVLFLVPSFLMIYIARRPVVAYFNSYWTYILMVNPLIIAAVHSVHVKKGAPSKYAIMFGLCVPGILLLLLADIHVQQASKKATSLMSPDCTSYDRKYELQRSWEAAYFSFQTCVNATGSVLPEEQIMNSFRLQDCEEYNAVKAKRGVGWEYLKYLEESQACVGWCYQAQQLWAGVPAKDSCSTVVSSAFRYFVKPHAKLVSILMLVVLTSTAILFIAVGPAMRSRGYDW